MDNPEQDSKWECLDENCNHAWYDDYIIVWEECPKCKGKNIKES